MQLNTISPDAGSRPSAKRLGRGIGSGLGKTSGRGHKGQKARSGGYHKLGFEGGQMPLQRRLPKCGFKSRSQRFQDEVTLSEINSLAEEIVNLDVLKAANLVNGFVKNVKIIHSGEIKRKVTIQGLNEGLKVTKGACEAIKAAGGKVED